MPRSILPLAAGMAALCLASPHIQADDAEPVFFVGTSRGGDAQLHPALAPVTCSGCPAPGVTEAPALMTIGAGLSGRREARRASAQSTTGGASSVH